MTNEAQIHAHANLEIPLTPEMAQQIAQARENAIKGQPGELHFAIEIKRADGRVEKHTLIGTVDGVA